MQFDALDFYQEHARRYSQLSHEFAHSVYTDASHPSLKGDTDLLNRAIDLTPGNRGLDAGCGARDVYLLHTWGYDVYGVDAVEENISQGKELHQEIAEKLQVADLREPLTFETVFFDFVLCNAVIQHLTPETGWDPPLGQNAGDNRGIVPPRYRRNPGPGRLHCSAVSVRPAAVGSRSRSRSRPHLRSGIAPDVSHRSALTAQLA